MSNVAFLWIFSRGMELGVIVLCLLPLRFLLRKKVPRLFSYLLWMAIPVNIGYNLVMVVIAMIDRLVLDYLYTNPRLVVDEAIVRWMRYGWCIGTIVVVFGMVFYYLLFLRRLIGSIRIQDNVYVTDRINSSFTLGLLKPKIYLPFSLQEKYYEPVILHEKVHIARRDVWMKYLAIGLLGLFWFQPILWFAYRLFINDMEEACDEAVLRQKGEEFREEYARSLVELSCRLSKVRGAAIGYGNGEIKARVRNVMNYRQTARRTCIVAIVLCCLFAVLAIPISWQVPGVVRGELAESNVRQRNLTIMGGDMIREEVIKEEKEY